MAIILPLHIFCLRLSTGKPVTAYTRGLVVAVRRHLISVSDDEPAEGSKSSGLLVKKFVLAILWCTVGITAPALLWFAALNLSS